MIEAELRSQEELPSTGELSYPFAKHGFNDLEAGWAGEAFERFQNHHRLFEDPKKPAEVIGAFVTTCNIPGVTQEVVRKLTEALMLTIFFNDRVGQGDCADLIDCSVRVFLDPESKPGDRPSERASAAVRRDWTPHIVRVPGNGVCFLNAQMQTFQAFRWESVHLKSLSQEMGSYESLRRHTIAVQPYLELWKLLQDFPTHTRMHYGFPLRQLEDTSTRIQYLANDLGSVKRDLNRGQRNAVLLHARAHKLDLKSAWSGVRELHDGEVASMVAQLSRLREMGCEVSLHRYLDQVEACTWGNLLCLGILADRYRRA